MKEAPLHQYSEKENVGLVKNTEYKLCSGAEFLLEVSMKHKEVIFLNESLLLKFRGRLAALALEDKDCFKKGWWYCPYGKDNREVWRDIYKDGVIVSSDLFGKWVEIRQVREFHSPGILEQAKKYTYTLTEEKFKQGKLTSLNTWLRRKRLKKVEERILFVDYFGFTD